MAIETALPEEDGSIIHLVQPGHTLWGIADAYGMTTEMVASLNGLDLKNPVVFSGQKLLVRMAFTATVSPTVTQTPRPPTRTPRPTFTPGPTRPTATASLTPKPTREPLLELPKVNTRSIGIGLVVVCALGLAAVLVSWVVRRKP
jgi:LysM repeat protein